MMFHYIDYADTAVGTRNRQRAANKEWEKETEKNRQTVDTKIQTERGERWERTLRNGASVGMRGGA